MPLERKFSVKKLNRQFAGKKVRITLIGQNRREVEVRKRTLKNFCKREDREEDVVSVWLEARLTDNSWFSIVPDTGDETFVEGVIGPFGLDRRRIELVK